MPGFRSVSPSDEMEALQTDVMRFMAILGLCLMAIFALVQSLPIIPPDTSALRESKKNLKSDITTLQVQAKNLKAEITGMQNQLEVHYQSAMTVNISVQKQRAKLTAQRRELEQLQQTRSLAVDKLENIAAQNQQLKALQTQLKEDKTKLHRLREKNEQAHQKLSKTKTRIKENTRIQPLKSDQNTLLEPSNPKQKGFTLRFTSEDALDHLIRNQTVSLYAFVDQHVWQLHRVGSTLQFRKGQKPPSYYQMSQTTVPLPYRQKLTTQLTVHRDHQVMWGVSLPKSITTQIQKRIKGRTGGDLTISANGRLEIH
ncbi:MAG: hypothetical protein V3V31_12550 [Methylococcales bacterium]